MDERFNCTTYRETITGGGQFVEFRCNQKDIEQINQCLSELVYSITIPNRTTVIFHGGYGKASRYDIHQHKYSAGGNGAGGGFIEVLEINNPPENRCGIILHQWTTSNGAWYVEWENLGNAIQAFEQHWGNSSRTIDKKSLFEPLPGFKRFVDCGPLTPWFYAIGDELLHGDYTFPRDIQEDPIFRYGNKFIVPSENSEKMFQIKTCMGCRIVQKDIRFFRTVYWDDGSKTEESSSEFKNIRPLKAEEIWIDEAMSQFMSILNGKSTDFSLSFLDGTKLACKLEKQKNLYTVEGQYLLEISLKNGLKPDKGTYDFKPSEQYPDLFSELQAKAKQINKEIETINVLDVKTEKGGKKWKGVFFQKGSD